MRKQTKRPKNDHRHDTSSNWGYRTLATGFFAGLLSMAGCAGIPSDEGGEKTEPTKTNVVNWAEIEKKQPDPEKAESTNIKTVNWAEVNQKQPDELTATTSSEEESDDKADASPQQSSSDQNKPDEQPDGEVTDSSSDTDQSGDETTDENEDEEVKYGPRVPAGWFDEEYDEVIPGEKTVIDWEELPE